jgi:acyl-coenzyme A synthetase/AMP-(fatty) acid ligase
VISIPDEKSGEVPKAFVVKSVSSENQSDETTRNDILKHVEQLKSKHKRLRGGVEFVEVIPKSPSGKILRRVLKEQGKAERMRSGAKL